jgi:hypothetical protein
LEFNFGELDEKTLVISLDTVELAVVTEGYLGMEVEDYVLVVYFGSFAELLADVLVKTYELLLCAQQVDHYEDVIAIGGDLERSEEVF